jgi:hypothetical protein
VKYALGSSDFADFLLLIYTKELKYILVEYAMYQKTLQWLWGTSMAGRGAGRTTPTPLARARQSTLN